MTPTTSSFATPSLAERVVARGAPGEAVHIITKLIWSINPHNTVLLESADGTERIVWDDGVKRYLHQTASCGKAVWTTVTEWTKNVAYEQLKGQKHWIVPHLEHHRDLAGPIVTSTKNLDQIDQSSQFGEDVESSLTDENDQPIVDSTGNHSDDPYEYLTSAAYSHTGAMVALVPTKSDAARLAVPGGEPIEQLHVTLAYLGEAALLPTELHASIVEHVRRAVDTSTTVIGNAFAVNWFNPNGDNPCIVLGVGGEQLHNMHMRVMTHLAEAFISFGITMREQHQPWIPHITLEYTDNPEPPVEDYAKDRLGPVTFDRIQVKFGGVSHDIPLSGMARDENDTDEITVDGAGMDDNYSTWNGVLTFDDDGNPIVPNALIPIEALQERDVNIPSGPGHSLRDYWVRGPGAAKIRWGTEGSFKRCVRLLNEYVMDPEGLCAEYHKAATGEYPRGGNVPSDGETVTTSAESLYDQRQAEGDIVMQTTDGCSDGFVMRVGKCTPDEDAMSDDMESDDYDSEPWQGILTVEGIESGDGRMFKANALMWDEPPLPLMWQKVTSHSGTGDVSVRVGSIDRIWREPDPQGRSDVYLIKGEGTIDMGNPDGQEVYRRMRRGYMRGNSVDVDSIKDADVEFVWKDPDVANMMARPDVTVFTRGRIRATTLVEIPAFTEARLSLVENVTAATTAVTNDDDVTSAAVSRHDTAVVDNPWNASANLRRLPTPMPMTTARAMFGWIDDEGVREGNVIPKWAGRFPHHEVSDGGTPGAANLTALSGTIGALNGARGGSSIPESQRQAVYNHIAAHMRKANVEPPPLLSSSAYLHALTAGAVPSHNTPTVAGAWDGAEAVRRLESPMSIETARDVFAWIDSDAVKDGMVTKSVCKLPHHDVSTDGTPGAANLTAVYAAIGALNGARGGVDIPAAQRQATYNHLAAHLRDADREVPPLQPMEGDTAALVAGTAVIELTDTPPREWFNEPTDVTPRGALTVTSEGRVYGYVAPANTRHRSFQDRAVYVPMKKVDYARFMGGETIVADGGRVPTGNITMGCGHATTVVSLNASEAAEHYDNTCSVVATVRVGENSNGIWVAGALLPDVTPDQVRRMMACRLSGDWRAHLDRPGWREFVAALLVPVPGFPMAHQSTSMSLENGELVASSVPINVEGVNDVNADIIITMTTSAVAASSTPSDETTELLDVTDDVIIIESNDTTDTVEPNVSSDASSALVTRLAAARRRAKVARLAALRARLNR